MRVKKIKCFTIVALAVSLLFINTTFAFGLMSYLDEFFALLLIPLVLFEFKTLKINKRNCSFVFFILLFVIFGFIGDIINQYQSLNSSIIDMITCIKFFMAFGTMSLLIRDKYDIYYIKRYLRNIILCISIVNFILSISAILKFNDEWVAGIRYGLTSIKLFYIHPTYYAAATFACALILIFCRKNKKDFLFVVMNIIMTLLSLRTKAILAVIALLLIYIMYYLRKKNRLFLFIMAPLIIAGVLLLSLDLYDIYFNGDYNARIALIETGLRIMQDRFPFGTGFATFASAESAKNYSIVYQLYGINNVYGLSEAYSNFISDSFWPMICGQTGLFGLISYCFAMISFIKNYIFKIRGNMIDFIASIGGLAFLLISSLAESSFVNSLAIPFAIIIALSYKDFLFGARQNVKKNN